MSKIDLEEFNDRLKAMGAQITRRPSPKITGMVGIEHVHPFATPQNKRRPGKWGTGNEKQGPNTILKGELPPWGRMDDATCADINPLVPLDWRPKADDWGPWVLGIINEIGSLIWPVYQPGAWTDATVGRMLDADFALLAMLRPCIGLPIESAFSTIVQHGDFFSEEDNPNVAFGTGYERYDPTLPPQVLRCFSTVLTAGIVDKVGSLDLILKCFFQRPRAYQVAVLQSRSDFSYQSGATANTPSLVSGHCLQGALAGCTVFAAHAPSSALNADSIRLLQHFTVDVGDRRVFAGVHYPSDNLASWYTALQLVPFVFEEDAAPQIKAFLWDAINSKSIVFDAIKKHIDANPGSSPYKKAVDAMRAIAGG